MNNNEIISSPEDIDIVDKLEYSNNIMYHFKNLPDAAQPLIKGAKKWLTKIEQDLYSAPAFINLLKSTVPTHTLQVILTQDQKSKLAKGTLKLMTRKDGSLMANLINPKTNRIASTISLENINISPDFSQALISYTTQMQMAQIAEQIQEVHLAIEEVRQGQESDRLATAYSCQQKLLQTMEIKNPELKSMALLRIVSDAEDSRNLLMQSQKGNLAFIKSQPESSFEKFFSGAKPKVIDRRVNEIRESLSVVNMVSLVEAIAYQELGEFSSAKRSLQYYAKYIEDSYLAPESLINRLDSIDSASGNYWTKTLPSIKDKIQKLPCIEEITLLEGEIDNGK